MLKPDCYLFAAWSRISIRRLVFVLAAAPGFAYYPDQDGDGDDGDDYQDE